MTQPPAHNADELTSLILLAAEDDHNARSDLYNRVYNDLRLAAHRFMRRRRGSELQTTALVNEVLLRFEKGDSLKKIENRRMFFAVAVKAMNQVLIDHYRKRKKLIDSPDRKEEPLDEMVRMFEQQVDADFEQLQIELERLGEEAPRQHAVIMHRFFGGLTINGTAEMLNVSVQTVERDWRLARAKLHDRLRVK